MKKEELVQLHMLLLQFKKFCEEHGYVSEFSHYHQLEISPFQVHRSKEEHKRAIFVLVTELVASLTESRVPRVYRCTPLAAKDVAGASKHSVLYQVTGEATDR
jgi:hypothetical protein